MAEVSSCSNATETYNHYTKEWNNLFHKDRWFEKLKIKGVKGQLCNSYFRSVCWKVFLECFPENPLEWTNIANEIRQKYENTLDKREINPWSSVSDLDLHMNHPLSQSVQSSWYNYFQDSELKLSIQQDVIRTFPEIQFFRSSEVQNMMINILFCYARENPKICYRQGMHELLAPIIYVLHMDQENYLEVAETENIPLDVCILLNQNYTEHDAFFLFCQLMEAVEGWYIVPESHTKYPNQLIREPFTRPLDDTQSNTLGIKLTKIQENHLRRYDPQLYDHLNQMEIAPQIYGIRWMRLLFGREFSLSDLLIVWDAIFTTSLSFDLVEYIFTAMLIYVRDLLLESDYTSCLSILMHYPVVNVRCIIDLALDLKDPRVNCKPAELYFDVQSNSYRSSDIPIVSQSERKGKSVTFHYSSEAKLLPLKNSNNVLLKGSLEKAHEVLETDLPTYSTRAESDGKNSDPNAKKNKYSNKQLRSFILSGLPESESISYKSKKGWRNFQQNTEVSDDSRNFPGKEMIPIKEKLYLKSNKKYGSMVDLNLMDNMDIHDMSMKLHKMMSMNKFCFDQMTFHLDKLRDYLYEKNGLERHVIDSSLNGLKEVCDILNKSVYCDHNFTFRDVHKLQDNSKDFGVENSITERSCLTEKEVLDNKQYFDVKTLESDNLEAKCNTLKESQNPKKVVLLT